jgi:hypothetical protein
VVQYISIAANALILIFGVPLLVLFAWKVIQLLRMIRLLRPLQITPERLKARLDAEERLCVIDLLRFEEDPEGIAVIPGSVRLDPSELRRKAMFVVPDNVDLVLYCSSKIASSVRGWRLQCVGTESSAFLCCQAAWLRGTLSGFI